jgi:2-hydroxy-3-keto-5-methylthiopentenyl-1-phosphate phosphatase
LRVAVDWDGTVTVRDSLVAAVHALGDGSIYDSSLQQRFPSYGDALAAEVATLTVTPAEIERWALEHVEIRAGFHEFAARYRPVIVSSGLPHIILPVLRREGLDHLEVRANDAEPRAEGWRVTFRHDGLCAVCGDRCKRRSLPDERPLAFVGDGWSDRCASLAADRVFARAGLAEYLAAEGVPYEPYETFFDVAAALS